MLRVLFLFFWCCWLPFGLLWAFEPLEGGFSVKRFKVQSGQSLSVIAQQCSRFFDDVIRDSDLEEASEIQPDYDVFFMYRNNKCHQALIQINDETQVHIYPLASTPPQYDAKLLPIAFEYSHHVVQAIVEHSVHGALQEVLDGTYLPQEFVRIFRQKVDFANLTRRGDKLMVFYEQRLRLGEKVGYPRIKVAHIDGKYMSHEAYYYNNRYYNQEGVAWENFTLARPTKGRISSYFSYRRLHPVLKRNRPHYGIDYAPPKGTPVRAAFDGLVSYAAYAGQSGKLVKIKHPGGYETRYAHMDKIKVRRGDKVAKAQIIGTVGNTGLSTGAHLHFGFYKDKKPLDPLAFVGDEISLGVDHLRRFKDLMRRYEASVAYYLGIAQGRNVSLELELHDGR